MMHACECSHLCVHVLLVQHKANILLARATTPHKLRLMVPPATPPTTAPAIEASDGAVVNCQIVVPLCAARADQRLVLVGSSPVLGSWKPEQGVQLSRSVGGDLWIGSVRLPVGEELLTKVSPLCTLACSTALGLGLGLG